MKNQIDTPKPLKASYDEARAIYGRSHKAARSALAEMMAFANVCFTNWEDFVDFCDRHMIRAHTGASDNRYIRVVRAVIGNPQLDESGNIEAWRASDVAVSRYAKVLRFADEVFGIGTKEAFEGWLDCEDKDGGGGTITDAYERALAWERSLPKESKPKPEKPPQDLRFMRGVAYLSAGAKEYLAGETNEEGEVSVKVDLSQDGAPQPGLHRLLVRVGDDGTVEYVGFPEPDEDAAAEAEVRNLLPPPCAFANAFPVLSSLVAASKVLAPDKKRKPIILAQNGAAFSAHVYSGFPLSGPVITAEANSGIADLPAGSWRFDEAAILALKSLDRNLRFTDWALGDHENAPCVMVTPQFGLSVEELIEEMDEKRKKPFEITEGALDTEAYCYVPLADGSGVETGYFPATDDLDNAVTITPEASEAFFAAFSQASAARPKNMVINLGSDGLVIEGDKGKSIGGDPIPVSASTPVKVPLFGKDVFAAMRLFASWQNLTGLSLTLSPVAAVICADANGVHWQALVPARKGKEYDLTAFDNGGGKP